MFGIIRRSTANRGMEQRHKRYLKQNHRVLYMNLLTSGKLNSYLADIDERVEEMFSRMVTSMKEKQNITEQLKAADMMKWLKIMNNIRACANEIVLNDIVYS